MSTNQSKKSWEPMKVKSVGHVGTLLQGGGGKLSIEAGDPGEPWRKPRGQDQFDPGGAHPESNT